MDLRTTPNLTPLERKHGIENKQQLLTSVLSQSFAQGFTVYTPYSETGKYMFACSDVGFTTEIGNNKLMERSEILYKTKHQQKVERSFAKIGLCDADFSLQSDDAILADDFKPHRDGRILLPNEVLTDSRGFLARPLMTVLVYFMCGANFNTLPVSTNPYKMNRDSDYRKTQLTKRRLVLGQGDYTQEPQIVNFWSHIPHYREKILPGNPDHMLYKVVLTPKFE